MSAPVHYEERVVYGPFKRIAAAGVQTPEDMRKIVRSGELWGGPPAHGVEPAAQAHRGPLRNGESGFEFFSDVPPDHPWGPPHWRARADGTVRVISGQARVKIYVSKVTMEFS